MKILVASPYPERIMEAFRYGADEIWHTRNDFPKKGWWETFDWIVSYGYRSIIKPDVLAVCKNIINIHISYLPWNRGADPNFWSWIDETPKGISIHRIDEGIDTGPVYSQLHCDFWNDRHTLRTTYDRLRYRAEKHFVEVWPDIRDGIYVPLPQLPERPGSYHKAADKDEIFAKLPLGWDTPVKDLAPKVGIEPTTT